MANKQRDPARQTPPREPLEETNPAHSLDEKGSYAGKPDQEVKKTTGAGAGGATEWGGGNKNHPARVNSRPPGG
ncbi:MAG TPA: hypothetical protein VNT28_01470 [Candidatus Limnocylindrales bacterium]|jgi:hypothetical protein|nr:hypothetical protein [Candidatus Limnocylindrales bacterium]